MILTKLIRNITGNSKRFIVLSNCLDGGNIVMFFFFKWNHKNMILMKLTTTTGNITWKDVWPNLLGLAIQSSWWQYCYGCPEMDHPANNRWNNSIEKRTVNKWYDARPEISNQVLNAWFYSSWLCYKYFRFIHLVIFIHNNFKFLDYCLFMDRNLRPNLFWIQIKIYLVVYILRYLSYWICWAKLVIWSILEAWLTFETNTRGWWYNQTFPFNQQHTLMNTCQKLCS